MRRLLHCDWRKIPQGNKRNELLHNCCTPKFALQISMLFYTYKEFFYNHTLSDTSIFGIIRRILKKTSSIVVSIRLSVHPSVRPLAWNISARTGRILIKFYLRFLTSLYDGQKNAVKSKL